MRYQFELDQDRLQAGWGRHGWVLDTQAANPDHRLVRLLPEAEARSEVERLNAVTD